MLPKRDDALKSSGRWRWSKDSRKSSNPSPRSNAPGGVVDAEADAVWIWLWSLWWSESGRELVRLEPDGLEAERETHVCNQSSSVRCVEMRFEKKASRKRGLQEASRGEQERFGRVSLGERQ